MSHDSELEKVKAAIQWMKTPLRDIPFSAVIEALTGHQVLKFDEGNAGHKKLAELLIDAGKEAGRLMNREGIRSKRPNEVGNYIEEYVRKALDHKDLRPETPAGKSGARKTTGYPDIVLHFQDTAYYLECKTYNRDNIGTTQRSFYLSPSEDFKVTYSTLHFLISFEVMPVGQQGDYWIYKSAQFKLYSIEDLKVDVKFEFNSDNRRLYSGKDGSLNLATCKVA